MAHWTDGPEYAPTERPDVFVEPEATPLAAPDSPPPAPTGVPVRASAPTGFTTPDAPALDALVPAEAPGRDPLEAFDVVSTPMTSAWDHAHAPQAAGQLPPAPPAWAPDQPFPTGAVQAPSHIPDPAPAWPPAQVNPDGFPQPGPPPWQQPTPPPAFEPVTFGGMLRHATPAVLISLALGALIFPFALALLVLASVLATRIRYRRRVIGRVFSGAIMGSFLLGALGMLGYQGAFDPVGWYDASTGWAQAACLVLLVAVPLIVGDAMRRNEPPEDRL